MQTVFQGETGGSLLFPYDTTIAAVSGYVEFIAQTHYIYTIDALLASGNIVVAKSQVSNLPADSYVALPQIIDASGDLWFLDEEDVEIQFVPDGPQAYITVVPGTLERLAALEARPVITDHGDLTGLLDDDHPQYLTDARGDARYWPLSTDLATQAELDQETLYRTNADATHAALTTSAHGGIVANTDSRLSDARIPTGNAGGVLSGTYPNPDFAVDMATQAELNAAIDSVLSGTTTTLTNYARLDAGNVFASGQQTVQNKVRIGSSGTVNDGRLYIDSPNDDDTYIVQIHQRDSSPYIFGGFNDTFDISNPGFTIWVNNNGDSFVGGNTAMFLSSSNGQIGLNADGTIDLTTTAGKILTLNDSGYITGGDKPFVRVDQNLEVINGHALLIENTSYSTHGNHADMSNGAYYDIDSSSFKRLLTNTHVPLLDLTSANDTAAVNIQFHSGAGNVGDSITFDDPVFSIHPGGLTRLGIAGTPTNQFEIAVIDSIVDALDILSTDGTTKLAYFDNAGDLHLPAKSANTFFRGPISGSAARPTWGALVAGDIPNITESQVTNLISDLAALSSGIITVSGNLSTHAALTTTAHGGIVPSSRTLTIAGVSADLSADRTFTVAYSNLTGIPTSFTPSAHASTHAAAGSDPITISEGQVTSLVTDLASRAILASGNTFTAAQMIRTDTIPALLIQPNSSSINPTLRLMTSGIIAGSGGSADLQFYDSATLGFRFLAAFGNASGSRYGGFIANQDRDGNNLPLRFFTNNASNTITDAMYIGAGSTQGRVVIRAIDTSQAAGLYIPWISGDALPTLVAGSTSTSNAQNGITARSGTGLGLYSASAQSTPIFAERTASLLTNTIGSLLTLKHTISGTPANGLGASLNFQLQSSTTAGRDTGQIASIWTDVTDATRTAALTFSTLLAGTLGEQVRITGSGAMLHRSTSALVAASIYAPWISGDTLPTMVVGSASASNAQDAIQAISGTGIGLRAVSSALAFEARSDDSGTSNIPNAFRIRHNTTGTPVAGFGVSNFMSGHSSTLSTRDFASLSASWVDATDATRKARLTINAFDTAAREGLRIEASGAAMIGFLGANASLRNAITGKRSDGTGFANLLTELATKGLITDSTTDTQAANTIYAGPTSGADATPTFRLAVAADVPNHPASKITSGQLALAQGGTNADLSLTGGSGQVLKQTTVGGNITVAALVASDLPLVPIGRVAVSNAAQYSMPGVEASSSTAVAFTSDRTYYEPRYVYTPITIDQLAVEVTTSGASTMKLAIYNATTSWQPSGLALNAGTIDCSSNGVKTLAVSGLVLQPGRYLFSRNHSSVTVNCRVLRGGAGLTGVPIGLGVNTLYSNIWVTESNSTYPTSSGTTYITGDTGSTPLNNAIFCRISSP